MTESESKNTTAEDSESKNTAQEQEISQVEQPDTSEDLQAEEHDGWEAPQPIESDSEEGDGKPDRAPQNLGGAGAPHTHNKPRPGPKRPAQRDGAKEDEE
ncbi:hypothetical protein K438DRAFT_1851896 [Mycena galopus ATCC 62051]|nr:hypothetical protein K438DRAFT_1999401 [Mycena galopus ATCC 62051]KAF8171921.1 hypothetical protein K438DRAFT_1851896 [Mycena galopus ATCC 62051]